jgi:hypothetical protein
MIVTTVSEVLDDVFNQEYTLYEGDVSYLFVALDDLLIKYERCGIYRNDNKVYQLYNVSNGHGKEGKLGVKKYL